MHLFVELITNGEFESECKICNMHITLKFIFAYTVYNTSTSKILYTSNQSNIYH